MNTIFDNLNGNVDLSIFGKSNTDPKTSLRRHYLSLVGLLEYVDILNGDLTGRNLPDGVTEETVKGMIIHSIGDLDTMKAMSAGGGSSHEYVDLGLPSGTLWATENIKDANGNELFFAWGETQGYTAEQVGTAKNFTWEGEDNDYAFGPIDWDDQTNYGMKKYNNADGLTVLEPGDDAAIDKWGEGWKMPTKEQFEELIANTEYEWTEIDGVQGAKFTSKVEGYTDKFLFFPAVGSAEDGGVYDVGDYGICWSVSLYDGYVGNAWNFYFGDGGHGMGNDAPRYYGYSVRPVRV
jgi:hypothetical protein